MPAFFIIMKGLENSVSPKSKIIKISIEIKRHVIVDRFQYLENPVTLEKVIE